MPILNYWVGVVVLYGKALITNTFNNITIPIRIKGKRL